MSATNDHLRRARQGIGKYHKASPDVAGAFTSLHEAALSDGEMSRAVKELMAVAIGVVTHCDGCVAWHLKAAADAGATRAMAIEALDVAVLMGGGPATISVAEAMDLVDELLPG